MRGRAQEDGSVGVSGIRGGNEPTRKGYRKRQLLAHDEERRAASGGLGEGGMGRQCEVN